MYKAVQETTETERCLFVVHLCELFDKPISDKAQESNDDSFYYVTP